MGDEAGKEHKESYSFGKLVVFGFLSWEIEWGHRYYFISCSLVLFFKRKRKGERDREGAKGE